MQEELTKLGPGKSAGTDGPHPMFLKAAAHIIASPVISLFNMSLQFSALQSSRNQPRFLFKGGSGTDPNCYRPISTFLCLSTSLTQHFSPFLFVFLFCEVWCVLPMCSLCDLCGHSCIYVFTFLVRSCFQMRIGSQHLVK